MKKKSITPLILLACLVALPCQAQVKVGLSAPLSGGQAAVGQDQVDGFLLGVEQQGGTLGGKTVSVIREDDQLKPELGNLIVRKFIERDKVDVIVGLGFSNVLMAELKPIVDSGTVAIATNAGPSALAGAACAPNVFSVAWQNDGAAEATGKYMSDKQYRRVYLLAPNYQAGKDNLAGFKRYYQGPVLDEVYTQVGQTDYSAEIAQLQAAKPDAIFVFYPGGMGVNFIKQLGQAGLLGKVPLFSVSTVDGITLPSLREAAVGAVSGTIWDATLANPANSKFVRAFEARYKRTPSPYAATGYDAAQVLNVALRKVNGKTADKKAFAAAVKAAGGEFQSVRGPFRFNNNNLPVQHYYVFEVVKEGGQVAMRQLAIALSDHADAYHAKCMAKVGAP